MRSELSGKVSRTGVALRILLHIPSLGWSPPGADHWRVVTCQLVGEVHNQQPIWDDSVAQPVANHLANENMNFTWFSGCWRSWVFGAAHRSLRLCDWSIKFICSTRAYLHCQPLKTQLKHKLDILENLSGRKPSGLISAEGSSCFGLNRTQWVGSLIKFNKNAILVLLWIEISSTLDKALPVPVCWMYLLNQPLFWASGSPGNSFKLWTTV